MSQADVLKTLIHEIAHARTAQQRGDFTVNDREIQAESIAYVVSQNLGLDTSKYSFGYVAAYVESKDPKQLRHSLEVIRKTSHNLINELEENMINLYIDKLRALPEYKTIIDNIKIVEPNITINNIHSLANSINSDTWLDKAHMQLQTEILINTSKYVQDNQMREALTKTASAFYITDYQDRINSFKENFIVPLAYEEKDKTSLPNIGDKKDCAYQYGDNVIFLSKQASSYDYKIYDNEFNVLYSGNYDIHYDDPHPVFAILDIAEQHDLITPTLGKSILRLKKK